MTEHDQAEDSGHTIPAHSGERPGVRPDAGPSLLESIVENIRDAVLVTEARPTDEPGPRIVYANEGFTRMTGYAAEEVIEKSPRILQGPDTDRARLDEIRAALRRREPVRVEILNYHKDGTEFWVELDITPVNDAQGNHTHWVSVQRDIAGRRAQQEALRRSEGSLVAAQRLARVGNWEQVVGRDLYWSDELYRIYGFTPGQFVPTYEDFVGVIHPDDWDYVEKTQEEVRRSGQRPTIECRIVRPDGEVRVVQNSFEVDYDETGGLRRIAGTVQDVTRRKEAEERLAEAERHYRTLVEQVPAIIYLHEPTPAHQPATYDYEVSYISPRVEEVLGYSPDEFLQNRALWNEIIHPDDRARVIAEDERTDASGDPFLTEYRMFCRDGREVWIREEASLIRGPEDEPLYWQGIMTDVTEQKLVEESLRLLESVAVNAKDAVLITEAWPFEEPGPRIVYANEAFTSMTGYSYDEIVGETPRLLQGEKTDREQLDEIHHALSRWEPVRVELLNYRKDGSEFWVEVNIAPAPDENGRITHWVAVQRETTGRRLVEERLRKSEAGLKRAERIAHLGNWEWNLISGDLAWSDEVFRVYGFTPGEFVPTFSKFTEALHPEDKERLTRAIDDAINKGASFDLEHRLIDPGGEERIVRCRGEVERDDNGELTLMFGTSQDVTEHRLAERALEESERRFRSLVQNSSEAVKITDAEGTLRYASPAFGRIFGYDPEEAIGINVLDYIHPEDLPRVKRETEEALSTPEVNSNMAEYRFQHADGSWRWVESVGTYLLDDPALEGVVINVRDITDRKWAEKELYLKNRAVDSSSNGMIITDPNQPDNPIIYVNPAFERITGYTAEETIGRNCRFLRDTDEEQPNLGDLRRALEQGREWSGTLRNYRKDGTTFWNELYIAPVHDEDGRLMNFIGVQKDVTERRRDEQALRESEQRLKAVTAGAPVIMFAINSKGVFAFETGTALRDLGLEPGANLGRSVFETYGAFPEVLDNVRRALSGEDVVDTVEVGERAYHTTYSPQFDEDGAVYEIIGVATDVTARWKLERDMEHWATHDPLTGLANRRLLFARLVGALDLAERRGKSVCLLFMDLNGFKEVNDRHGHEAGDALLAAVAGRIERCLRSSDTAARVGGDEFCVLLEGDSGTEEAVSIAGRLAASLETPFSLVTSADTSTVEINASIGIAVKDKDSGSRSPDELVREADAAMYRAKRRGGELYEVIELKKDTS